MPIQKDIRREHYGPEWQAKSKRLREAAGRCQCRGMCGTNHPGGQCHEDGAVHVHPDLFAEQEPESGPNRLQVAHINRTPGDDRPENLIVLCAACHMRYDRQQHVSNRRGRERREAREALEAAGQQRLPLE